MILVQNHRQLLNGNSIILLLITMFLVSSCGIFSDSSKRRTHRKKTKRTTKVPKHNKQEVDSLKWPSNSIDKNEEESIDLHGTVIKDHYTIDLLIPFNAKKQFNDIGELEKSLSNKFSHYYGGVILALEDLEKQGINLTLNVKDAPLKNDRTRTFKREMNLNPPDLIIGPHDNDQLKVMALYAKNKDVTIVSPWKAIPKLTYGNPNYIQIKPSLRNHYKTIIYNVDDNYAPSDVYLLGLKEERKHKKRIELFQKIHKEGGNEIDAYNVFYIDKDSLLNGETAFDTLFDIGNRNKKVFIVTNWSGKDESFVYSVLRRLNIEKGARDIVVYGMPLMTKSTNIGYNLFKRLNIHVVSPTYSDDNSLQIKKIKNRFFKKYNCFPKEDALEGYDMMMYIGENLNKYGTKFQYFNENNKLDFLNSSINLNRKISKKNLELELLDKIEYFENTNLYILGFKLNKFEKL